MYGPWHVGPTHVLSMVPAGSHVCVCVHVPVCVVGRVPGPLQGVCTATRRAAACSSLAGEGACETRPWLLAMH